MGLDMYVYKTREKFDQPVDFKSNQDMEEEIKYWRKFNNLHGWMERLYRQKGGDGEFNLTPVQLDSSDLDQLEQDVKNKTNLEPTEGFFFGQLNDLNEEDEKDLLEFIQTARQALKDGYTVFYTSWW